MQKKKVQRLGRGLSSLLSTPVATQPESQAPALEPGAITPEQSSDRDDLQGLRHLPIELLAAHTNQPRQHFDETSLQTLADSIRENGMMQPIIVRRDPDQENRYQIVAGERRWRAARLAGLSTVPALEHQLDDQQVAEWALIENLQREDLNPMERAEAFSRLIERFELSHDDVATRVGLQRSTISNFLRLLVLSDPVRQFVRDGLLSMGQARALAGIEDPDQQIAAANRVVREGLSVRQTEALVRALSQPLTAPAPKQVKASHVDDLERQIGEQLKTKVQIRAGRKKGTGSLTIEFYSLDQFDHLIGRMGVITE